MEEFWFPNFFGGFRLKKLWDFLARMGFSEKHVPMSLVVVEKSIMKENKF